MYIAKNNSTNEILVMADDQEIPFPLLKSGDGEWCRKLPEVGTIIDTFTPVKNEGLLSAYYSEAYEKYKEKFKVPYELVEFINREFPEYRDAFETSFNIIQNNKEKYKYLGNKYNHALNRLENGDIDKATRRFYEVIAIANCFNDPFLVGTVRYLRIVYLVLVWHRYVLNSDYLSDLYNQPPIYVLKIKMKDDPELLRDVIRYINIDNNKMLTSLSEILSKISDFDSDNYIVGERLFGKVYKVFPKFKQIQISVGFDKCVTITNREGLDLWSARDVHEGVVPGTTLAICTRRDGDDVGTRCGPQFVGGILDVFFPLLRDDKDRKIDAYLGASNSLALIVARAHEKTRLLAGGGELSKELASILGVKRLLVTNCGYLSREESKLDEQAMISFIRNFINDFYSVCIIDLIDFQNKLLEIRIPTQELKEVNIRHVRSLFGLSDKILGEFNICVYYGNSSENRIEITREYASNFREHSLYESYG